MVKLKAIRPSSSSLMFPSLQCKYY